LLAGFISGLFIAAGVDDLAELKRGLLIASPEAGGLARVGDLSELTEGLFILIDWLSAFDLDVDTSLAGALFDDLLVVPEALFDIEPLVLATTSTDSFVTGVLFDGETSILDATFPDAFFVVETPFVDDVFEEDVA